MNSLQEFKKIFKGQSSIFTFLFLLTLFLSSSAQALEIPQEWASVYEKIEGSNGRTIILIQEAHVDYGAQKAIVEILKTLIQRDSLRLVLVEGGWGDVNLSYLRHYGSAEGRLQVAERYLKEGKISGEEYLDLVSDLDFKLWGIEDPQLYAENMDAFLKIHGKNETLIPDLAEFEARLKILKEKHFPAELLELEKKKSLLDEKKISLLEYLQSLRGSIPSVAEAISMNDFPNLHKILSLSGLGKDAVDPEKAEWEKQNLIKALTKKLTKPELEQVQLLENRKSTQEESAFLKTLLDFQRKYEKRIGPVSTRNLKRYSRALEEMTKIDPRKIFSEMTALEEKVNETFLKTEEQRKTAELNRAFGILRKLFELKLSPEEFTWMEKHPEAFQFNERPVIQAALPEAKAFYLAAQKREEALLRNIIEKIEAENAALSAVILGGFHADQMAAALKEKGYSLWVVAPRFTPADPQTQHRHYFEILKYKWQGNQGTVPARGLSPLKNPLQGGNIQNVSTQKN